MWPKNRPEENPEAQYRDARERMVREQIEERGIHDPRVLDAMRRIPRHWFVHPKLRDQAYTDGPLAIGLGQTISQPYMVAAMTTLLGLRGDETVLEIGTGSGYQAAVLGELARQVHTIERHPELAERARQLLENMGFRNVSVHTGDGSLGWPTGAPYHAVLVTAAAPEIPQPLIDQLEEGGLLVIPVGGQEGQNLERWRKTGGRLQRERLFPVAFVPLRGRFGWKPDEWDQE